MRLPDKAFFCAIALCVASPVAADDIGAAARGVVRIIVVSEDYSNEDNSSVVFGSGFAISPHRIVTNAHVVRETENVYAGTIVAVVPSEGTHALRGTVVAIDPIRDLAIVDVGSARLEPLALFTGPVDAGLHAAALGYPGNVDRATANSVYDLITPTAPVRAEGNISSQRSVEGTPAFLHTAAISRGNSGGPLVDDCGRVLGVNTYTAVADSGDAPFGFAIVSQEVMSFLRDHGEKFQQVGNACLTMAQLDAREDQAKQAADRQQALADQRTAQDQEQRLNAAKLASQDSRENHAVTSGLLALLALIAGGLAAALFLKDRARTAAVSGAVAAISLAGGAYAFFSRPSLNVELPKLTTPTEAEAKAVSGKLICQVVPERSRVTVSSTEDLQITWDGSGCMNGRTQYVESDGLWRRILVPNGSETVYVQDFDPHKGEYVSKRYLLPQSEIGRMRQIRAESNAKFCSSVPSVTQDLERTTRELSSALPSQPNEKILYHCATTGEIR